MVDERYKRIRKEDAFLGMLSDLVGGIWGVQYFSFTGTYQKLATFFEVN